MAWAAFVTVQKFAEMTVPPALTDVLDRIARAAKASGRDSADVTLVAVSKMQPWEKVAPILAAGQRVFGETRVLEAMERWERLSAK